MSVSRARGDKAKADKLFSLIVRSRGSCEACGSTRNLQTMHIISRRYSNTRTDLANAYCGCASCHMFFTSHPVAFGEFVFEKMGRLAYDDLHLKSLEPAKVDWAAEYARLKAIWQGIEAVA